MDRGFQPRLCCLWANASARRFFNEAKFEQPIEICVASIVVRIANSRMAGVEPARLALATSRSPLSHPLISFPVSSTGSHNPSSINCVASLSSGIQ